MGVKHNKLMLLDSKEEFTIDKQYCLQNGGELSRHETIGNIDFLVVPMILLTNKVVSAGNRNYSSLVTNEVISQSVTLWNGTPVIVDHPTPDNEDAYGNNITTKVELGLGELANTSITDSGKLYSELWINKSLIEQNSNQQVATVYERLSTDIPCEISVGVNASIIEVDEATFDGKAYTTIWNSIAPLHVAVLETATGACSIKDGCGTIPVVLQQSGNKEESVKNTKTTITTEQTTTLEEKEDEQSSTKDCSCASLSVVESVIITLFESTMYSRDKSNLIKSALEVLEGYDVYIYAYNNTSVIYEKWNSTTYVYTFYKIDFNVINNIKVELLEDTKAEVILTTNVIELFNNRKKEMFSLTTTDEEKEIDMDFKGLNTLQAIEEINKEYPHIAAELSKYQALSSKVTTALINRISTNTNNTYSIEQLNSMSYDNLVSLSTTLAKATNAVKEVTTQVAALQQAASVQVPQQSQVQAQNYQLANGSTVPATNPVEANPYNLAEPVEVEW